MTHSRLQRALMGRALVALALSFSLLSLQHLVAATGAAAAAATGEGVPAATGITAHAHGVASANGIPESNQHRGHGVESLWDRRDGFESRTREHGGTGYESRVKDGEEDGGWGPGSPGHTVLYQDDDDEDALRRARALRGLGTAREEGVFPGADEGDFLAAREGFPRAEEGQFTTVAYYGDSLTRV